MLALVEELGAGVRCRVVGATGERLFDFKAVAITPREATVLPVKVRRLASMSRSLAFIGNLRVTTGSIRLSLARCWPAADSGIRLRAPEAGTLSLQIKCR